MKKTKRIIGAVCLAIVMAMVAPVIVPSLSGTVTVEAASKVKLNKKKATVYVGKSTQLKVTGTKKKVTWKSSNKKVATVTRKGKVTAKKKGTATITATVSGKKYTCKVTVKDIALKSISLNKTSLTLDSGNKYKLKVKYNPSNTTVSKGVTWSSSNSSVVTVDKVGNIRASSVGKATITAKVGTKKAKCVVTVKKQESSTEKNLRLLKEFISKYGNENNNGDKFIKWTENEDDSTYSFGIIYEEKTNRFEFLYLMTNGDFADSKISMYINMDNRGNVSPNYIVVFNDYSAYCNAKVSFNAATYKKDDTVNFKIIESEGIDRTTIQKLANSELRLAFAGWDLLLTCKVNLELNDIGFTSYK